MPTRPVGGLLLRHFEQPPDAPASAAQSRFVEAAEFVENGSRIDAAEIQTGTLDQFAHTIDPMSAQHIVCVLELVSVRRKKLRRSRSHRDAERLAEQSHETPSQRGCSLGPGLVVVSNDDNVMNTRW